MNAKEYYTIWIDQQSKEFINSKIWPTEKVVEFAEDYNNGKFLNEEVLAEKDKCGDLPEFEYDTLATGKVKGRLYEGC